MHCFSLAGVHTRRQAPIRVRVRKQTYWQTVDWHNVTQRLLITMMWCLSPHRQTHWIKDSTTQKWWTRKISRVSALQAHADDSIIFCLDVLHHNVRHLLAGTQQQRHGGNGSDPFYETSRETRGQIPGGNKEHKCCFWCGRVLRFFRARDLQFRSTFGWMLQSLARQAGVFGVPWSGAPCHMWKFSWRLKCTTFWCAWGHMLGASRAWQSVCFLLRAQCFRCMAFWCAWTGHSMLQVHRNLVFLSPSAWTVDMRRAYLHISCMKAFEGENCMYQCHVMWRCMQQSQAVLTSYVTGHDGTLLRESEIQRILPCDGRLGTRERSRQIRIRCANGWTGSERGERSIFYVFELVRRYQDGNWCTMVAWWPKFPCGLWI